MSVLKLQTVVLELTKKVRELTFSIHDDESENDETEGEPDWYELVLKELDVDEDRLREEMEAKREEHDGLVTLDSSLAILVARDHGLKIVDKHKEEVYGIDIGNVVEGLSDVAVECTVDSMGSVNQFDGGQVRGIDVNDSTGTTQLTFWNEEADEVAKKIKSGDKIRVKGCYTKKEMSDYQDNVYGVPAIQFSDDATLEVYDDEKEEFVEVL